MPDIASVAVMQDIGEIKIGAAQSGTDFRDIS
jgi:hypothetical protein